MARSSPPWALTSSRGCGIPIKVCVVVMLSMVRAVAQNFIPNRWKHGARPPTVEAIQRTSTMSHGILHILNYSAHRVRKTDVSCSGMHDVCCSLYCLIWLTIQLLSRKSIHSTNKPEIISNTSADELFTGWPVALVHNSRPSAFIYDTRTVARGYKR